MDLKCPQCNSQKIAEGKIYNQIDYVAPRAYFRPHGLKPFSFLGVNVRLENRFFACINCGFLWSKIDTTQLIRILKESGTPHTKKRLALDAGE
ncbi:MAG: hypothetical protein NC918_05240 [Candidatus Omnitrophica bacterium]|nr:hypothetical protein [Candidatus Omnitrophota bacterium]